MTEVSRILRNIFFPKIPPILKLKVDFFPFIFFSAFFFEIVKYLSYLNFISVKFKKNRRTFLDHHHSFIATSSAGGLGSVWLGCTRKSWLGLSHFFFFFFSSFFFFFFFFSLFFFVFFHFLFLFFLFSFFFFLFFFFLFSFFFFPFFLVAHGFGSERARLVDAACRGASLLFFFLSFFFLFSFLSFSFSHFSFFFSFFFLSCTRLRHRTCKTSRRGLSGASLLFFFLSFPFLSFSFYHFIFFLVAHGFGTERARLVDAACLGASLRSWFQKTCLLPIGISIFFPQNTLDFET